MTYQRTFQLNRLFHKFLKSKNVPFDGLTILAGKLDLARFIDLLDGKRYVELPKLTEGKHKDELFSIIEEVRKLYAKN